MDNLEHGKLELLSEIGKKVLFELSLSRGLVFEVIFSCKNFYHKVRPNDSGIL